MVEPCVVICGKSYGSDFVTYINGRMRREMLVDGAGDDMFREGRIRKKEQNCTALQCTVPEKHYGYNSALYIQH